MNEHTNEFDKLIAMAMNQITEAASKHDLTAIQRRSRIAAELQELKEQQAAIHQRKASLEHDLNKQDPANDQHATSLAAEEPSSAPVVPKQQANAQLRKLPIEVTAGDINQNLLKLTPHMRRSIIKAGEEMVIGVLPSGRLFQTVVLRTGNKLRERSEIARFYRDAHVNPGDYVLLAEQTRGRWTLSKAPPGLYEFRPVTE